MESAVLSRIGLAGLAVMGQNLALNIAEKGFPISVYNRTTSKVDETVSRASEEGSLPVSGHHSPREFVLSIRRPRSIILLVKAGNPVDQTISALLPFLDPGDSIIDGGNEWYELTERRQREAASHGLLYLGMGVSGGEDGARHGPSLMPGGHLQAYKNVEEILVRAAAQVDDGPCVTFVGEGGAGNFVKMVHNGIEYGDMQLIAEAYDVLRSAGGLSNSEIAAVFEEWNRGELESFLVEITADIFCVPDEHSGGELVDKILDKTGMKGTGKWTVQQAAELSIAAPTIAASLDSRYLSGLKDERVAAAEALKQAGMEPGLLSGRSIDKKKLIDDVRQALYASKICSYAQGMNLLRAKSEEKGWNLNLGELARIWKGGCIIRARFLDRIKKAYERNRGLANLIVDPEFAREMVQRQAAWRRVVGLAVEVGISTPGMCASLAYFDTYRRARLPANLVQAQRDYFGAHTYERVDHPGSFHTEWSKIARKTKSGAAGVFN
ncbi:6-phosphogluconate dehydrogenase, decarboxylating 3, chloroplastic-like [Typha latifolia]|uniref:6-phosphogluconate dehydrogenase, decarboxylating 3, chloroplastic-like n=1 Tax=Typha latifolia TaxID=4733 RepID=UPI003C2F5896